jgi:hypothetical protein
MTVEPTLIVGSVYDIADNPSWDLAGSRFERSSVKCVAFTKVTPAVIVGSVNDAGPSPARERTAFTAVLSSVMSMALTVAPDSMASVNITVVARSTLPYADRVPEPSTERTSYKYAVLGDADESVKEAVPEDAMTEKVVPLALRAMS